MNMMYELRSSHGGCWHPPSSSAPARPPSLRAAVRHARSRNRPSQLRTCWPGIARSDLIEVTRAGKLSSFAETVAEKGKLGRCDVLVLLVLLRLAGLQNSCWEWKDFEKLPWKGNGQSRESGRSKLGEEKEASNQNGAQTRDRTAESTKMKTQRQTQPWRGHRSQTKTQVSVSSRVRDQSVSLA